MSGSMNPDEMVPVHMWFLSWGHVDIFIQLLKTEDNKFQAVWRLRISHSPDPWDPKDKKFKFSLGEPTTEEIARQACLRVFEVGQNPQSTMFEMLGLKGILPDVVDSVPIIDGDVQRALEDKEWVHMKHIGQGGPVPEG